MTILSKEYIATRGKNKNGLPLMRLWPDEYRALWETVIHLSEKADQYDKIMQIANEDSLASDGLEMIYSAMRGNSGT